MDNDLIKVESWWQQHWKWCVPLLGFTLFSIAVVISSGIGGYMVDFVKAYAETDLYDQALQKAQNDQRVQELIGVIEPIDKLAILEGEARYTNANHTVDVSIRIKGSKRKAVLDISADKINGVWEYKKIHIRIKKPIEEKQTIEIIN